jgi:L-threonylcarbamoyladenylate synthase
VSQVQHAIDSLRAGALAIVPTDTVYGLAGQGDSEDAARALYAVKGRSATQPTALLFASVELVLDRLPELPEDVVRAARALLPGPVTLVLPNPARRYAWLNGTRPDSIGIRVPELAGLGLEVLEAVGVLVATSANRPGGADPRRVEDVPAGILDAVAAVVDAGELPGAPSTVIDLTSPEPRVLREGALAASEAVARARSARNA